MSLWRFRLSGRIPSEPFGTALGVCVCVCLCLCVCVCFFCGRFRPSKVVAAIAAVPWPAKTKEHLTEFVAQRASKGVAASGRPKLQDFVRLPHFLTSEVWCVLQNDGEAESKVEQLAVFAASLGLRHPTEATFQMMTALVLVSRTGSPTITPSQKYASLQHMKRSFRSLQKLPEVYVPSLPATVERFKQDFPML